MCRLVRSLTIWLVLAGADSRTSLSLTRVLLTRLR
jgi:hypothetical protein